MAALSDIPLQRVVDLRQVQVHELDHLLAEEIADWDRTLNWDFGPSADLVRRFVSMQALSGYALFENHQLIGYTYYVCEDRKGLVGDLYLLEPYRTIENENLLLRSVLEALFNTSLVSRVESQLMMLGQPFGRAIPMGRRAHAFERVFMVAPVARVDSLAASVHRQIRFEPWAERHQDRAAHVIADAYTGHIDSRINDQYRSAAGARRFLQNIVQYPGCGVFFQAGSFIAFDRETGHMEGICLSSLVKPEMGHITQICVTRGVRGLGIGYELLRRSLLALRDNGSTHVSLTVTAANHSAIALYERAGFARVRTFAAFVWESE